MSQNLPTPPADDQHALVTQHIAGLAMGPDPMNRLADVDARLLAERAAARQAGDDERAEAVQRLIDFLDAEVATVAHAFAAHLQDMGPAAGPAMRALMEQASFATRQQGWGMHVMTLSMLRDGLRNQTLQGQPAWEVFVGFVRDYRPAALPDAAEFQSAAAREILLAIANAHDAPTVGRLFGELLQQQDDPMLQLGAGEEDPDVPGLPAPFVLPGVDPLPEADEMLLKQAFRTRIFTLFNEAYLRGLRVEGVAGAAEAIHAVIEPDIERRMQQANPVVANGEEVTQLLEALRAEDAMGEVGDGVAEEFEAVPPMRPRAGEERMLPNPVPPQAVVAAPVAPAVPAEPALPADEINIEEVRRLHKQGTALVRTLLKGMGFQNVDQEFEAAFDRITQQLKRGGPSASL